MNIPEKAIICINTLEEYSLLNDFFETNLGRVIETPFSHYDAGTMCCDLEPNKRNVISSSRASYTGWCRDYDSGVKAHEKFVPDDVSMRFISVHDFLAICGADSKLDFEFDLGSIL